LFEARLKSAISDEEDVDEGVVDSVVIGVVDVTVLVVVIPP
jgi:hypothetical protein